MSDAVLQDPMPEPDRLQRDAINRVIALTWHGIGSSPRPGSGRWLVAVDGSDGSLRAVEMASRLGADGNVAVIDLVHVQSWLNKEAAENELARRGWVITRQARKLLDAKGIRWHLHTLLGEEALEISRLAEALGSSGIALGSRGLTATESVLLGSVAQRVSRLAKTAVLIVR